jgi:hypothetical protein
MVIFPAERVAEEWPKLSTGPNGDDAVRQLFLYKSLAKSSALAGPLLSHEQRLPAPHVPRCPCRNVYRER